MSNETQNPSKKRKWYAQSFKEEWLQNPELKDWLQQDKNDSGSSYCKCCNITMKNANNSMLMKHKESVHKKCFARYAKILL